MASPYDAFLSYRWKTDYPVARRVEAFLEGFHSRWKLAPRGVRPLQVCRDGSDFRLPIRRKTADETALADPVWSAIEPELDKASRLLVLCSPGAVESTWVASEVEWFVRNRGAEHVLLAVTDGDPQSDPAACLPMPVLAHAIHTKHLWYDLRRLRDPTAPVEREPEDELVRLAADLLDWDEDRPLLPLWEREQVRQKKTRTRWATFAAGLLSILAVIAIWQARASSAASKKARANALVLSADASDPLTGVLLLTELPEDPGDGMRVARRLAAERVPSAVLRGHTQAVQRALFISGERVATASADGTVRIWNRDGSGSAITLRVGTPVSVLETRGTTIAAGSDEGSVYLWDGNGRLLAPPLQMKAGIAAIVLGNESAGAIDNEGRALVFDLRRRLRVDIPSPGPAVRSIHLDDATHGLLALQDGSIHAFTIDTHGIRFVQRLGSDQASPDALAMTPIGVSFFSGDARYVATVFSNELVLRTLDGRMRRVLAHPDMIQSVTFSTDGAELLTACSDGMVRVFPTAGGDAIVLDSRVRFLAPNVDPNRRPEVEAPAARAAVFSPDGKWVAALCGDGPTRIWPANGGGPPVELMNAFGATSVAFDSASAALIAGTDQGTASIYSLAAPAEPRELPRLKDIYDAATSPDATVVAAVGSDGIARVWKEGRWRELRGAGAKGCAYDADRGRVAVAHSDGAVRVWNEALRDAIELHGAAPLVDVAFSPDGRFVYAWSKRELFRWELAHPPSGSRVSRFPGPASDIWSVSTSGDGVRVLITYDDGSIALWRGDSGMRFRVHTRSVYEGVLNDDGTQAVTVSGDGTARVWTFDPDRRSATIRTVSAPAGETMDTVALSPDGRRFAATTSEGRALLAPVRRGKTQLLRTHGDLAHIGVILQARFSADGMHLLTCGAIDGAARYWDLSGRTNAVTLANHASTITQCAVSRDGRRVMTATENGWVRIWSVRFENVVAASAARTTATLTPQQRMMLLGETADDAYEHYALDERKHRRIPLPRQWSFDYPTW